MSGLDTDPPYLASEDGAFDLPRFAPHTLAPSHPALGHAMSAPSVPQSQQVPGSRPLPMPGGSPYANTHPLADPRYMPPSAPPTQSHPPGQNVQQQNNHQQQGQPLPPPPQAHAYVHTHQPTLASAPPPLTPSASQKASIRLSSLMEPVSALSRTASLTARGRARSRDRNDSAYMMVDDMERAYGAMNTGNGGVMSAQRSPTQQTQQQLPPLHQQQSQQNVYNNPLYPNSLTGLASQNTGYDMYSEPTSPAQPQVQQQQPPPPPVAATHPPPSQGQPHRRSQTHNLLVRQTSMARQQQQQQQQQQPVQQPPPSPARQQEQRSQTMSIALSGGDGLLPYAYSHNQQPQQQQYAYDGYTSPQNQQQQTPNGQSGPAILRHESSQQQLYVASPLTPSSASSAPHSAHSGHMGHSSHTLVNPPDSARSGTTLTLGAYTPSHPSHSPNSAATQDLSIQMPTSGMSYGPQTAPAQARYLTSPQTSQPPSGQGLGLGVGAPSAQGHRDGPLSMPASPMSYSRSASRQQTHNSQQQQQPQGYFGQLVPQGPRSEAGTPMLTDPSPAQSAVSTPRDGQEPGGRHREREAQREREREERARERERAEREQRERERERGLVRVRDSRELRPIVNPHPLGRRPDPSGNGTYLSPLKCLTSHLSQTYNICNPAFNYESAHNPRRVLTKPSKPVHNEGYDNEDNDYILYVNDFLGGEESSAGRYLILDVLGQGTFGQVVKCQNIKTHEIVAVKVVKNKPAYFNQSMMEVTILELLNKQWDPNDEHHILRLRDTFIHKKHLCLVFELLSSNLYELIKQNQFGGLSTQLVKVFTAQLLDALSVLKDARLIHCDLKPENILLKSLQSPQIKVIDFGSACHERQTVYTYIQSRFYRSPEVLLGMSYTSSIDMWSLGCIVVELFLGLPLFPGTSEYNQITRIVEMLGMPPTYMLEMGKSANDFFKSSLDEYGRKKWRLKSLEEYCRDKKTSEQPGKKYFSATTLPEIIKTAPNTNKTNKAVDMEKEANLRLALIDFVQGLLSLDPMQRWSPQQALGHPFITGEKFTKPYVPADMSSRKSSAANSPQPSGASPSSKRPYGGLIPSQPSGTRAYQDAASYNQQLNQHQQYSAQAATAAQQQSAYRNPYATPRDDTAVDYTSQQRHAHAAAQAQAVANAQAQAQAQAQQAHAQVQAAYAASQQQQQQQQQAVPSLNVNSNYIPVSSTTGSIPTNPPSAYYGTRARANTINQMDVVPPQLAKFAHLAPGVVEAGGLSRNSLTPILNRDDAMREWERRHGGGGQAATSTKRTSQQDKFAHTLDYLAEQAELQSQSLGRWAQQTSHHYPRQTANYQSPTTPQTSYAGNTVYHTPSSSLKHQTNADTWDYEAASWRHGQQQQAPSVQITSPPQAYASSTNNTGRYNAAPATSYQNPSTVGYDQFDVRDGMGTLYAPMQPQPYQQAGSSTGQQQNLSFYGSGVVSSGAMPNTPTRAQYSNATSPTVPQSTHTHQSSKDSTRRMSGMDSTQQQQWRG